MSYERELINAGNAAYRASEREKAGLISALREIAGMDDTAFGAQTRLIEAKAIASAALAKLGG